jgi:hypothetical protein
VPKADGQRELATCRDAEHRGAFGGQRDAEARPHPLADIIDEKPLVCREPVGVETRGVLVQPQHLIGQPVYADDHRGRHVGRLEVTAPLRDQLTVTREHDCLGRTGRDVNRDLATAVVAERLGDELSRDGGHCRWLLVSCTGDLRPG